MVTLGLSSRKRAGAIVCIFNRVGADGMLLDSRADPFL